MSKIRVLGFGSLFFFALGIFLMIWPSYRDNDLFWRTRTYTVLRVNQSEHIYKGQSKPDYFQRIVYDDEPNVTWTRSVDGVTYFSQDAGHRYNERYPTKAYDRMPWYFILSWVISIILLSFFLSQFEL